MMLIPFLNLALIPVCVTAAAILYVEESSKLNVQNSK